MSRFPSDTNLGAFPSGPPVRFQARLALCFLFASLATATTARAEDDPSLTRPIQLALTVGVRTFPEELSLDDTFSFGGRLGIGIDDRWGLILDFVACHTTRNTTAAVTYVDALRGLGRYNIATGRIRPYLLAGAGGVWFIFHDASTTAGGTLTLGGGADYRIASRARIFLEASTDLYSQEEVVYSAQGDPIYVGPASTETLGTVSLGIGVEF